MYVTGVFTETDAAVLAPLAHHSALPILLTVSPQHEALPRAAAAGWRAAAIPPDVDLAAAWADVVDRGSRRVVA